MKSILIAHYWSCQHVEGEFKMNKRSQKEKAETLLSLHMGGDLLVLPNIWDPIGARILAAKAHPAVATASAAVSASLGYQDGEKINFPYCGRSGSIESVLAHSCSIRV
jgi:hypothetical protein